MPARGSWRSWKGDPALFRAMAVSGDYPGGCGTALAGSGYYQLTVATGGEYLSICDPAWGTDLLDRIEALVEPSGAFALTHVPVPASLVVGVGGEVLEEGWAYDADSTAVVFDEIPHEGATILVDYERMPPECETW